MSRFYFGNSSDSDSDNDALPYPEPLARSAFLTPDFSPTEFLSSLQNRHQTLEDLRTELRTRSQELSKELLDLVNDNYQDFLELGDDLRGGDEKVEEVRVGFLGFKREVDVLKVKVEERRKEVERLLAERRELGVEIRIGSGLLEVSSRLEELEESLKLRDGGTGGKEGDEAAKEGYGLGDSSEESDEDVQHGTTISLPRLHRRIQQYVHVQRLINKFGPTHPLLAKQESRILRIRQTLLLDLSSVLKQCMSSSEEEGGRTMQVLGLYRDMDEPSEAARVAKTKRP